MIHLVHKGIDEPYRTGNVIAFGWREQHQEYQQIKSGKYAVYRKSLPDRFQLEGSFPTYACCSKDTGGIVLRQTMRRLKLSDSSCLTNQEVVFPSFRGLPIGVEELCMGYMYSLNTIERGTSREEWMCSWSLRKTNSIEDSLPKGDILDRSEVPDILLNNRNNRILPKNWIRFLAMYPKKDTLEESNT